MNKFLTIYLNTVESIEATANQLINLLFQPLYAIARVVITICEIWNIPYEENEAEEPEKNNERKIGFLK